MKRMAKAAALAAAGCALVVGGAGAAVADPTPVSATAAGSPGILSGNVLQVPLSLPLNLCGTSAGLIGLLNPATATCAIA